MQLMDLPDDLLGRIVGNLKVRGQACVAKTNARLREVVAETQRVKLAADSRRPGRISDELVPTFGELERHGVVLELLKAPTLRALAGPANAPKAGPLRQFYEYAAQFTELEGAGLLTDFSYDRPPRPGEGCFDTHLTFGTSQLDERGLTTGFGLSLMRVGTLTSYLGFTKQGLPHGMGLLRVTSMKSPTSFYLGFWREGRMHGRGEMRTGGTIREGNWSHGQFVGSQAVRGEVDEWPAWAGLGDGHLGGRRTSSRGGAYMLLSSFPRLLRRARVP